MGVIVNSGIQLPQFYKPVSNTYVAFGTTPANIYCRFDASGQREFQVDIQYGVWYSKHCFLANLQPITRFPMTYIGNVEQVANVQYFLELTVQTIYPDSYTDGIDN
jgi:hypothetical protein